MDKNEYRSSRCITPALKINCWITLLASLLFVILNKLYFTWKVVLLLQYDCYFITFISPCVRELKLVSDWIKFCRKKLSLNCFLYLWKWFSNKLYTCINSQWKKYFCFLTTRLTNMSRIHTYTDNLVYKSVWVYVCNIQLIHLIVMHYYLFSMLIPIW